MSSRPSLRSSRATSAYPEDTWYAWLNGKWVRIPPEKIVPDYAPDGQAYLFVLTVSPAIGTTEPTIRRRSFASCVRRVGYDARADHRGDHVRASARRTQLEIGARLPTMYGEVIVVTQRWRHQKLDQLFSLWFDLPHRSKSQDMADREAHRRRSCTGGSRLTEDRKQLV